MIAYKKYILPLVLVLLSLSAFAQPEADPQDEAVPVDGGVGILMAAGAAWGIKKLKERK